jgi:hypothetical protein
MASRREDQFSYIVSSDGCLDVFPENHASNFKIMLKDPIEFKSDEDWEVGLIDLHYPYSWYNVSTDMLMLYADGTGVGRIEFPDWQCSKLSDLVNYIQEQLSSQYVVKVDHFGRFRLEGKGTCCDVGFSSGLISLLGLPAYDDTITIASFRRRAEYRGVFGEFWKDGENPLDNDEHLFAIDWTSTKDREIIKILEEYLDMDKLKTVTMFNKLTNQLNSVTNNNDFGGGTAQYQRNVSLFLASFKAFYGVEDFPGRVIVGEYMPRMNPVLQLHIYSNIVQPIDMNDTTAKLMKIVNIRGTQGSMTQEVFTHPTYQPVEKTRKISMIHVYIKNEIGKFVPFVEGQVLVTLHFRRQRHRH